MDFVLDYKRDLFLTAKTHFDEKALQLFKFQYERNMIYRQYAQALKKTPDVVHNVAHIPFLPISFFKTHRIVSHPHLDALYFESSGTTGEQTSKLYVRDISFYWENAQRIFEDFFGNISDYSFFFLLPNYLERKNSSLVSMAQSFWEKSNREFGGFYLYEIENLKKDLEKALKQGKTKVILWGVTFALLDFSVNLIEKYADLLVFETGGMKGRGQEPIREEVHDLLKKRLGTNLIHSEYGMTELFSQAYSLDGDVFSLPATMKVYLREPEDPLAVHRRPSERGGINVIDLANIDTCAFIETQDLGMLLPTHDFQVLGRFDNSDIRGCNLMVS